MNPNRERVSANLRLRPHTVQLASADSKRTARTGGAPVPSFGRRTSSQRCSFSPPEHSLPISFSLGIAVASEMPIVEVSLAPPGAGRYSLEEIKDMQNAYCLLLDRSVFRNQIAPY